MAIIELMYLALDLHKPDEIGHHLLLIWGLGWR